MSSAIVSMKSACCSGWRSSLPAASVGIVSRLAISSSLSWNGSLSRQGVFCLNGNVNAGGMECPFPVPESLVAREGFKKFLLVHVISTKERLLIYILLRRKNAALVAKAGIRVGCPHKQPIRIQDSPGAIDQVPCPEVGHADMVVGCITGECC